MKIAFCGTSGAGKTTLVKYVSETFGLPWISGSSGDLKTEADKNSIPGIQGKGHGHVIAYSATHPLEGWTNQWQILDRRSELIMNNDRFVTDRSPIDNVTYAILQCAYHKEITNQMVEGLIYRAGLAYEGLTHLIYIKPVQPNGDIENNQSRITNAFYQRTVDAAFDYWLGVFMEQYPKVEVLPIDYWDLQRRKDSIDYFLAG